MQPHNPHTDRSPAGADVCTSDDPQRPNGKPAPEEPPPSTWRAAIRYWWQLGPKLLISRPAANAVTTIAGIMAIAEKIL